MTKITLHCWVTGRVQGVWYRGNTQKQAERLGLTGWVRNLEDGRVEAILCGEETQVNEMLEWMRRGPRLARVEGLTVEPLENQDFVRFEVK